jgi:flagellar motor switch protein FliN/FliY
MKIENFDKNVFLNKIQRDCFKNQFLNNFFEILNKKFSCILEKKVFLKNNFLVKVNFLNMFFTTKIKNFKEIQEDMIIFQIKLFPSYDKIYFIFSKYFLFSMIDKIFGGEKNFCKKDFFVIKKKFFENIIIKQLINNFFQLYLNLILKMNLFELDINMSLKSLKILKKKLFKKNFLYIFNSFNIFLDKIYEKFYIFFSRSIKKNIRRKFYKKNISQKFFYKNSSLLNLLKNFKVDFFIFSKKSFLKLKEILNLKIGNILFIKNPEKSFFYIENIPFFKGNYKIIQNETFFLVKKRFSNIFYKNFMRTNFKLMNNKNNKNFFNSSDGNNFFVENLNNNDKEIQKDYKTEKKIFSDKKSVFKKKLKLDDISLIENIPIIITVELGKSKIKIKDLLSLEEGSIITLNKVFGEPLNIFINDHLIAKGEVVVNKKKYGIRILKIFSSKKKKDF